MKLDRSVDRLGWAVNFYFPFLTSSVSLEANCHCGSLVEQ